MKLKPTMNILNVMSHQHVDAHISPPITFFYYSQIRKFPREDVCSGFPFVFLWNCRFPRLTTKQCFFFYLNNSCGLKESNHFFSRALM